MGNKSTTWIRLGILLLCIVAGLTGTVLASSKGMSATAVADEQTITFRQGQDGYAGCVDTRISEENPTQNYGEQELVLGMKGRVATLIRFDVSSIPAGATVQEAVYGLFVSNYGQRTDPIVAAAYSVIRSWAEMEATWIKATNSANWGLPGCNDVTSDRSATPLDNETIFERDQWYTWNVTSAVQGWLQNPTSNKGLVVRQTNLAVGGEYDIRQSEYAGLDVRPYLRVRYTLGRPTPTESLTPQPLPCEGTPVSGGRLGVLQDGTGYAGTDDTTFNFDDRDTLYAGEWFVRVGYKRHYGGLIKFDVTGIPRGSQIVCAALSLYGERWSGGNLTVGAFNVKRANSVDQATWSLAALAVPWQAGGCNGPDDREQVPESTITVRTIYRWYHLPLTRLVDGWVNGGLANHGVSLQAMDELDQDTVWFTSSDDSTVANRPKLVILYVPPSGWVPTQTSTATATATPIATPTPTRTPGLPISKTLQNGAGGYEGSVDTRISAEAATSNFDALELKVGARQGIASLIRFDLTSVPSNASIQSAFLHVYGYHREGEAAFDLAAYSVKRPWIEEQSTWNIASSLQAWSVAGCNGALDRAEVVSGQVAVDATGWYSLSVKDDVQRMVGDASTNAGWLLRQLTAAPGVVSMYSSEHTDVGHRPRLVVTYLVP